MGQGNSKIEVTKADKAILQLKISKDELHRYTKHTETLVFNERKRLKSLLREDPKGGTKNPRARILLKKIHYQSRLLDQAADQLINLENLVATVEFKLVERQFMAGLKQGNEVLTRLNREFKGAEDLMDSVAEQIAYQEEIDQVLSSSVVGGFEEELDRELEALDQEVNGTVNVPENSAIGAGEELGLPDVPADKPVVSPEMPSTGELPRIQDPDKAHERAGTQTKSEPQRERALA
ncbi:LANO_0D07910g1_1 [Lachancea nothofagi CBS 11611]|uniref:LANO_0D07910g1_1 n=1 Tax=Lachancea nothofagi CBS 11611 TaxID=1266666 RepID=A0A1G4JIB7_9SACH|nr:LANO_0D07910g1_1 [Lachancea nothofagi CBS 11611]